MVVCKLSIQGGKLMKTYEIRASRIVYDFYEIEANSLQEAESLALCSTDKVNTFETVSTVDYCKEAA